MGRSSQRKGRAAELELSRILNDSGFQTTVGTPLNYGAEPDLSGLPGLHCEVKRCEQVRLSEWMRQAIRDAEKFRDGAPTVFHRRNREDWFVTMRFSDWIQIYKDARRNREEG